MSKMTPFKRTCRPFADGEYAVAGSWGYITHPGYAEDPEHYTRAYLILQKDLLELFDFIEPADINLKTYSFRIHALLMRTCIEVEANCKAILTENGYHKNGGGELNITDFARLDSTHRLSSYKVKFPTWRGVEKRERTPFVDWSNGAKSPTWYKAYNKSKHDRHGKFSEANFDHLIDAILGLLVLISAQFWRHDFSNGPSSEMYSLNDATGFGSAIGGYFQIRFPSDWPAEERYGFDYEKWKAAGARFDTLSFGSQSPG